MPWGRLDDTLYDHPKLDEFPTDGPTLERIAESLPLEDLVRLAGVGLWALGISYSNRHLTDGAVGRSVVARKLHGSPDLADAVVRAGLLEPTSTGYVVHDFLVFNDSRETVLERREKDTQRKADWRKRKRGDSGPSGTDDGTPSTNGTHVTSGVTPGVTRGVTGSRAPAGAGIRESRPKPDPTRPDPTQNLSKRGSPRPPERDDIAALHERGWKRVTAGQRKVLDEVLGRHDVTGPAFAAEVIRATPADRDPLAEVLAADRAWQERRRRAADETEATWSATKSESLATAGSVLAALLHVEPEDGAA